ncbi:MAG: hypothetical protein NTX61_00350 [Bacteroidetes bacterium]|nr:hypothetical protein [Bacteroidota bacterium]
MEQEEPYEGRPSRTVLWERRGETPLRDPTRENIIYIMQRFLMTLFLFLCLFSCKKKEQEQSLSSKDSCKNHLNYTDLSIDETMNGFFFKAGSFWIYKNDSLNTYDSVLLKNVQTGCESISFPDFMLYPGGNWDYYNMNYYSYPLGEQYYDILERNQLMRNCHPSYLQAAQAGWTLFFGFPDTNYIDSMQIDNHTFYQICKSSSLNTINNPLNITAYTANNIGIVKKIINFQPKQQWNLVRWKIYK